ncbi:MAG: hypothetical protein FRX48_00710 [Lasallia pustulata]|uniref:Uncharacterized protein n=1 Tax=Lasallia pustulata TaxID=136370 RepID=A0A5M8Q4R0_9LECA|nr:MAG: hypothetical protein FRX48_00710 [Lasallia pustulata]
MCARVSTAAVPTTSDATQIPLPTAMNSIDLDLGLSGSHVLVTGGAGYIGSATVCAFLSAGAKVTALDINPSKLTLTHDRLHIAKADITSEADLESAFEEARLNFGVVQCCVALASLDLSVLPHLSLLDMPVSQWRRTFQVNVEGTFLTARTWLRQVKAHATPDTRNVNLVIIGSESGWFGERTNADYASGKSAVQVGLVQSLKGDIARIHPGARVNAVAPGPVDTAQFKRECAENPEQLWLDAQATTALGKPVPPASVAKSIVYLASEAWSGHVTGQVLNVDSGKQGKVMWTKEQCR